MTASTGEGLEGQMIRNRVSRMLGSPRCSSRPRARCGLACGRDAPRLFVLWPQDAGELAVMDPRPTRHRRWPLEAGPAEPRPFDRRPACFCRPPEAQKIVIDTGATGRNPEVLHPGTPFGIATDARGRLYISDWNRDVSSYVDGTLPRPCRQESSSAARPPALP